MFKMSQNIKLFQQTHQWRGKYSICVCVLQICICFSEMHFWYLKEIPKNIKSQKFERKRQ